MRTPYVSPGKSFVMKPVLAPLLPADMASAKSNIRNAYTVMQKCLCPEGRLCTDSVSRIVSCTGAYILFLYYFRIGVDTCLDWRPCQGSCL